MNGVDPVINTKSSTANVITKEALTTIPKSEDAELNNQDLQDDEPSMKQTLAEKARSFLSVAGYLSFQTK